MFLFAGCGSSSSTTAAKSGSTSPARTSPAHSRLIEVLSVPEVGTVYARCDLADQRWPIAFVNDSQATDEVLERVGAGRARTAIVKPGHRLSLKLAPGRSSSQVPASSRAHTPAQTIRTTAPVVLSVDQGTEPHVYRVRIRLALATALGDSSDCALVSSAVHATTYYNGGPPPP
jgi:hypothetical protein